MDTSVRDITSEAKELLQKYIIATYPALSDRVTRQRLTPIQKMALLAEMDAIYEHFEAKLLEEIKNSRQTPSML